MVIDESNLASNLQSDDVKTGIFQCQFDIGHVRATYNITVHWLAYWHYIVLFSTDATLSSVLRCNLGENQPAFRV